jgi:hypothetical protein
VLFLRPRFDLAGAFTDAKSAGEAWEHSEVEIWQGVLYFAVLDNLLRQRYLYSLRRESGKNLLFHRIKCLILVVVVSGARIF